MAAEQVAEILRKLHRNGRLGVLNHPDFVQFTKWAFDTISEYDKELTKVSGKTLTQQEKGLSLAPSLSLTKKTSIVGTRKSLRKSFLRFPAQKLPLMAKALSVVNTTMTCAEQLRRQEWKTTQEQGALLLACQTPSHTGPGGSADTRWIALV
jgi:hypothetical protein